MSTRESSQKFIARNRAPRVQIEYDVEVNGATKAIELPFVNGVISDLSGDNRASLPPLGERKFLEIDSDNFDERLSAIQPAVRIKVPNELTGEGDLDMSIRFQCMDDFSPGTIARQVEPLRQLLEVRNHLSNLLTYMDGKSGAEHLVAQMLQTPALLQSLTSADASDTTLAREDDR